MEKILRISFEGESIGLANPLRDCKVILLSPKGRLILGPSEISSSEDIYLENFLSNPAESNNLEIFLNSKEASTYNFRTKTNAIVCLEHLEMSSFALREILASPIALKEIDNMLDEYCDNLPPIQNEDYISGTSSDAGSSSSSSEELSFDHIFDSYLTDDADSVAGVINMTICERSHSPDFDPNNPKPVSVKSRPPITLRVAQLMQDECSRSKRANSEDWGWFISTSPSPMRKAY